MFDQKHLQDRSDTPRDVVEIRVHLGNTRLRVTLRSSVLRFCHSPGKMSDILQAGSYSSLNLFSFLSVKYGQPEIITRFWRLPRCILSVHHLQGPQLGYALLLVPRDRGALVHVRLEDGVLVWRILLARSVQKTARNFETNQTKTKKSFLSKRHQLHLRVEGAVNHFRHRLQKDKPSALPQRYQKDWGPATFICHLRLFGKAIFVVRGRTKTLAGRGPQPRLFVSTHDCTR